MANYFVINNKFKPYSFDELIKPYQLYAKEYDEQEAKMDDLLDKAASLDNLSPTLDKQAYDSFQAWKDSVKTVSDNLATRGLNPRLRNDINNLSKDYKKEQLPRIAKLTKRSELVKEQRDYLQKHPNSFFDVDYSNIPIDKITPSSTYHAYDLDDIAESVYKDAYGKVTAGKGTPSEEDYVKQYTEGLTNPDDISRVTNAIKSGKDLADAKHKQDEFDNYIKKINASRRYSSSSSSSGRGILEDGFSVPLPDGTVVNVTYNKKTKEYEYKDKDSKTHITKPITSSTTEDEIMDDVVNGYYGGQYMSGNVSGLPLRRVITKDKEYFVRTPKGWQNLPLGPNTTVRDYFNIYYPDLKLSLPTEDQLSKENYTFKTKYSKEKDLDKALRKGDVKERVLSISELNDYVDSAFIGDLAKKLSGLYSKGLINDDTRIRLYTDSKGKILKYNVGAFDEEGNFMKSGDNSMSIYNVKDWNAPIEIDTWM